MAKKKTFLILLIIESILLCACSGKTPAESGTVESGTVENAAELVMSSLKTLDLDTFNRYTDNYICTHRNWIGIPTSKEYRVFNELLQPSFVKNKDYRRNYQLSQKIMQNLSWEIDDVRKSDKKAEIDITVTNLDLSVATGNYIVSILENMSQSGGLGIVSLIKDMLDLGRDMDGFLSVIDSMDSGDTCTTSVTLSAFWDDGMWKLHVSDEFINAFMGGNIDSDEYPEEIEERLTDLEEAYEEKAARWAEEMFW